MTWLKNIWYVLNCRCNTASRLLSDGSEQSLSRVQRWALRLHLMGCQSCRRFRRQLEFLQRWAVRHAEQCPLTDETLDEMHGRIRERLEQARESD